GSTHSIEITKNVGQTIAYGCTTPWGTDCVAIQSATAPDSELSWINVSSGNTTADFTLVAAAKNPLVSIAPTIDAGVAFHLRPGGTTVRGIHDRMPVHEIYFYVDGWGEWEPVYRSDAWFLPCLGGYAVAPGCETKFSVLL
ncbi:MAG TPA: DUF3238 domain-containing protein, partial [Candidatus Lustribacter sp.]|nr:DUF3238 domain-containing protein [Candidatus Lustribacter sp.]